MKAHRLVIVAVNSHQSDSELSSMEKIVPFESSLSPVFRDLNLEWLEAYFYVEPHDRDLLDNCQEMIIDQGGHIFFYQQNEATIGTFALIKINKDTFELGKMAVSPAARGKGIGQKMLQFCIKFAQEAGWKKLILYSNTSLENSIYIYKKFGFIEVPIGSENPYSRGNIKMEKQLNSQGT